MVFIYVLQLKEDKWYIGKTESSKFRIDTHFDNKGSGFTKKYPPEEIYQIIPECDKYDEDKYVKKYMDKYGIDNVRGGSFSRLELTEEEKKSIQKELWGANDLCFLCGGDHFVKDCPNNEVVKEFEINNNYTIDSLLLDRILKRIIGFPISDVKVEPGYSIGVMDGGYNKQSRIHFEHYLCFDNLIVTEYINNNKEIMSLYRSYIDTINCTNFLALHPNSSCIEANMGNHMDKLNRKKLICSIEYKIKSLIVDLCYIKLNEFIQNKYHNDYLLTNFSININFEDDLCKTIYFNHFIEDYWKNEISSLPNIYYLRAIDINKNYLVSNRIEHTCFYRIANIHVNGELHYRRTD